MRRAGNVVIGLGMAGLTATIAAQWRATGYPPFSNMPESLLWMAWGFCAVYFVARIFVEFTGLEFAAWLGAWASRVLDALRASAAPAHARPAEQLADLSRFHVHALVRRIFPGVLYCDSLAGVWREAGIGAA